MASTAASRKIKRNGLTSSYAPEQAQSASDQRIYALIWDDKKHGGTLWKRLRLPRQRRYQRQLASGRGYYNRVSIEQRPVEVKERRHIGHWEGDTVLKGHKESGLVTLVERRSSYLSWQHGCQRSPPRERLRR